MFSSLLTKGQLKQDHKIFKIVDGLFFTTIEEAFALIEEEI